MADVSKGIHLSHRTFSCPPRPLLLNYSRVISRFTKNMPSSFHGLPYLRDFAVLDGNTSQQDLFINGYEGEDYEMAPMAHPGIWTPDKWNDDLSFHNEPHPRRHWTPTPLIPPFTDRVPCIRHDTERSQLYDASLLGLPRVENSHPCTRNRKLRAPTTLPPLSSRVETESEDSSSSSSSDDRAGNRPDNRSKCHKRT